MVEAMKEENFLPTLMKLKEILPMRLQRLGFATS